MAIVNSLLDTDFYKLTMMQAVFHNYTNVHVKYKFYWRNWDKMDLPMHITDFFDFVLDQIYELCTLRFTDEELDYLKNIRFFTDDFIEFLRIFQLNPKYINYTRRKDDIELEIEGPWLNTILFETPILAIISELYTKYSNNVNLYNDIVKLNRGRVDDIINFLNTSAPKNFKFGDFGTRRRASFDIQQDTLSKLKFEADNNYLIGTSNVHFAKELGIKPLGTHAHEWFQAHQQLYKIIDSQKMALQKWADEYRGDLGIALSDTLGFDTFLSDFDKYFAKLFDGCRHDSGSPFTWASKLINHYKNLGIDPKTKTALFSDNLTISGALGLFNEFNNEINTAFGIGTSLTNNLYTPPQIVIKMTECNGMPVGKLSDDIKKSKIEEDEYRKSLQRVVNFKLKGK